MKDKVSWPSIRAGCVYFVWRFLDGRQIKTSETLYEFKRS
jgi:hypothetical protein